MEHGDHAGVRLCTDVFGWGADGQIVAPGGVEEACRQGGAELVASLEVGLQQDLATIGQLEVAAAEHVDRPGGIDGSDVLAGCADGQAAKAAVEQGHECRPEPIVPFGAGLLEDLAGSYALEPPDDGTTRVTYRLEVALGMPIPSFLVRQAAKQIVRSALGDLKRRAESM